MRTTKPAPACELCSRFCSIAAFANRDDYLRVACSRPLVFAVRRLILGTSWLHCLGRRAACQLISRR